MSNMILYRPLPIAAVASDDASAANLLTPEPKEVWADAEIARFLHIDMGAATALDSFLIGYLSKGSYIAALHTQDSPNVNVSAALASHAGPLAAAPVRLHDFIALAAPVTSRWWRMDIAGSAPIRAGVLAVGLAIRTTHNREKGAGRPILDLGAVEARSDGGFGTGYGAVKSGFRWTWGDLDDAEIEAIYDLGLRVGGRKPIVVAEDPDPTPGLNERLHYGRFDGFEPYERGDPSKHRWSLSMTEWV